MRIPLPVQFETRQGDVTKDARIKNGYVEIQGETGRVRKRPGNTDLGLIEVGASQLLACWNGLLSVVNGSLSSLTITNIPAAITGDVVTDDMSAAVSTASDPWQFLYFNNAWYVPTWDVNTGYAALVKIAWDGASVTVTNVAPTLTMVCDALTIAKSNTSIVIAGAWMSANSSPYEGEIWSATFNETSMTFVSRLTSATRTIDDVFYLNGVFLAFLFNGTDTRVSKSVNDGVTWTTAANLTDVFIFGAFYDGSQWVFIGRDENTTAMKVYFSSDLVTFSLQVTNLPIQSSAENAIFVEGKGYFAFLQNYIYQSDDALTWVTDTPYNVLGHLTTDGAGEIYFEYAGSIYRRVAANDWEVFYDGTAPAVAMLGSRIETNNGTLENGLVFISGGEIASSDFTLNAVTDSPSYDEVTPTIISSVTPSLALFATSTGAAQSQQQLFIKSSDQAWIYTE